jgi:hypothetical protein
VSVVYTLGALLISVILAEYVALVFAEMCVAQSNLDHLYGSIPLFHWSTVRYLDKNDWVRPADDYADDYDEEEDTIDDYLYDASHDHVVERWRAVERVLETRVVRQRPHHRRRGKHHRS